MLRYAPKNMGSVKKKKMIKYLICYNWSFLHKEMFSHSHHMNMNLYLHCIFACNPMQPSHGKGKVFSRKKLTIPIRSGSYPQYFDKISSTRTRKAQLSKIIKTPLKIQECAKKLSEMASLSNSGWQNCKERLNRSKNKLFLKCKICPIHLKRPENQ